MTALLRNRSLGFGTLPPCGDWAPHKTSKPPMPHSHRLLTIPINFNKILNFMNSHPVSAWALEAVVSMVHLRAPSATCASGPPGTAVGPLYH